MGIPAARTILSVLDTDILTFTTKYRIYHLLNIKPKTTPSPPPPHPLPVTINEIVSFTDHASGIRLPDCSKLAINWKKDNYVTIYRYDVIVKTCWGWRVSLLNFSYWFKFHVNIITGSGVKTIFVYKGWTEIRNTPV